MRAPTLIAGIERKGADMAGNCGPSDGERGNPAAFDPESGEVSGSGSGAGGGNPGEDFDSDPMAGSGSDPAGGPRERDRAADRPIDPDEGR